jgi:hypothetical protein
MLAAIPLPAAEDQTINLTTPNAGKLSARIPADWKQEVIQPKADPWPTLKIKSPDDSISLQITFLPDPEERFATKEGTERAVTFMNQRYVAGSVEKKLTLTPLNLKQGHGCFAAFTDAQLAGVANPPKGKFRNVASGLLVINKQAAIFTLLANDTASPEYRRALQILSEGIALP